MREQSFGGGKPGADGGCGLSLELPAERIPHGEAEQAALETILQHGIGDRRHESILNRRSYGIS
jgi:hypothetical protein